MSREWTLAFLLARRASERARRVPVVAVAHPTAHARGSAPVTGDPRTNGEAARSVSPRGLFRRADAVGAGDEEPFARRGTRLTYDPRRGHHALVPRQPEVRFRPRPTAASRDVDATALLPRGRRERRAGVCGAALEGEAIPGGELAEFALAAVARPDETNPARAFDAFPTGGGKA